MKSEEYKDLSLPANNELVENAEFHGNRQDEEDLLLTAQRYLNIFHQLHIFNDRKKEEFNQSLLDMPEKVKHTLIVLPGGRILLEYMQELKEKHGIIDIDLQNILLKNPGHLSHNIGKLSAPADDKDNVSAIVAEALKAYSQNLQKMNEQIMQKAPTSQAAPTADGGFYEKIAEILRINNQQQMDMMRSFGETLTKSLLQSQSGSNSSSDSAGIKKNTLTNNSGEEKKNTSLASPRQTVQAQPAPKEMPVAVPLKKADNIANSAQKPLKPVSPEPIKSTDTAEVKTTNVEPKPSAPQAAKQATVDIDLGALLNEVSPLQNTPSQSPKSAPKPAAPTAPAPIKPAAGNAPTEKPKPAASSPIYDDAMRKIKDAISLPPTTTSAPAAKVHLDDNSTDVAASFYNAFDEPKTRSEHPAPSNNKTTAKNNEDWVYIDDNGNTVDAQGNPVIVSDDDWEYVDENGNPISDDDWEYVDENGNPVK